ncbi:MAG: dihydroneopterin aldolase [Pseudomonadota bacterium]
MTPPDRIIIDGLKVQAFIGVHDFERGSRQGVRFDVEIETVPDYPFLVRKSGHYVSYADTVAYIIGRAASDEHVELVETWAEDIAAFALRNDLVAAVRVTVRKTDIFAEAEGVGISIERRRKIPSAGFEA